MLSPQLIQKYNTPAPRYTSYPTVPLWENNLNGQDWEVLVKRAFGLFGSKEGITLYIHLPFCESLCTYCGCNKRITKNHSVESPYIEALFTEWKKYLSLFEEKPKLNGIHLGGGTPTFFSPDSLRKLLLEITQSCDIAEDREFSFEGHPNNTTFEHLEALADLGFDRVSYGIQDFDEQVQRSIHRIQPFEAVEKATQNARNLGYTSINFDLIYGLPHQTIATLEKTFERVAELMPDRIAFYSYAHVPSSFPAQKSYEQYLPSELEKRNLYDRGKEILLELGYVEIGMDHFSRQDDPLAKAKDLGKLHRNFMGFTTSPSKMLIGLGASSISDIHLAFMQNEKGISAYQEAMESENWPIVRSHAMSDQDLVIRNLILDLICKHEVIISEELDLFLGNKQWEQLAEMQDEGLIEISPKKLKVTDDGVGVIRQICKVFDLRLQSQNKELIFSKAI
ncbi:MAG: oxygen-independent coproporphyrinogen III oxidase HemN [Algoriphagus marincola HL-49]|uniref:Coproporphyrinogen-III oxidase n=1 Tax=Algoriphagus marincola HL-49 TaxID=1305737 RepID=A0A0P7YSU2_9BACT|nr:MAG: oxygen-independent coproporphyrinogen III oxidase HemN [Algoriphagus marincola HL-49]